MQHDWNQWGRLAPRYQADQPRRMLALDGGGIRGLLTVRALVSLEDKLRAHYGQGDEFRLCHFFDYIGGTSTGAILAAGLARGMSARHLLSFYKEFGREAFAKSTWFAKLNSLYGDGALAKKLQQVFRRSTTLEPQHLQTLLLVVTRNKTTDSAWPISSNPSAKYNDADRSDCNLKFRLWQLVRASTAAPVYFPAEVIKLGRRRKEYVFVDGGTTPFNCPAFLMSRMATEPRYRLGWKAGERNLLVVSLGTGSNPVLGNTADNPDANLLSAAQNTLSALMNQAQVHQDVACRTVGRCTYGGPIDREVGDLVPVQDVTADPPTPVPLRKNLKRAFLYARYDAELTDEWLASRGLGDVDAEAVRSLDAVEGMPDLERIGERLGEEIDLAHFGTFLDTPLWTV